MPDDHKPGWLDRAEGLVAEARRRNDQLRRDVDDLTADTERTLAQLGSVNARIGAATGVNPARVYVHTTPEMRPETTSALREMVGRAIETMGHDAVCRISRDHPVGLSVRVHITGGCAYVEPEHD